ncbi:MAG: hypothetical protein R3B84_15915 [Zavarzinella sp.]
MTRIYGLIFCLSLIFMPQQIFAQCPNDSCGTTASTAKKAPLSENTIIAIFAGGGVFLLVMLGKFIWDVVNFQAKTDSAGYTIADTYNSYYAGSSLSDPDLDTGYDTHDSYISDD